MVYYYYSDRPSGLLFSVPALLLSVLAPLFLPSSSVSLSYFIRAVPMRECLGKHSLFNMYIDGVVREVNARVLGKWL